DIGVRDNSRIMAPGTMMVMPKIIHPDNTQAYEREKKEEKKDRKFESVRWKKTKVKEGEDVLLRASVKDIEDGNGVTLQVFGEGQGPEDGIAYAKLVLTVEGGAAEGVWSYRTNGNDIPPERNPRFIFSAHSAWCPWKKSENSLEVELRRPKIEKTEWQDADGKTASKGTVGTPVKLYAEVTEFEEGQGVTFTVYNARTGEAVYEAGSDVQDGKAEALWTYHWDGEELKEKPKYYFEVTANRCKPVKSTEVEIGQTIDITLAGSRLEALGNVKVCFFKENEEMQKESSDGTFKEDNLIPGDWNIKLIEVSGKDKVEYLADNTSEYEVIKTNYFHMIENGIPCIVGKKQLIIIDFYTGISE
ncbi:MAG: hypothetical protein ACFNYQ_12185, partial [Treponema sp.]